MRFLRSYALVLALGLGRAAHAEEIPDAASPTRAVWAMFEVFSQRNPEAYVWWMTDDFLFASDDPEFRRRFPSGLKRADELEFARHLFQGGGRGPRGNELPTAVQVAFDAGPMEEAHAESNGRTATVVTRHYHVRALLEDRRWLDFGDTRCEFELIHTEEGWRIRRWNETVLRPDSALASVTTEPGPPPSRLELAVRSLRGRNLIVFDATLPGSGGKLEMFDVMGRRIATRDLGQLGPGRHTIAMEAGDRPSGVYFARLVQGAERVTRNVVWLR